MAVPEEFTPILLIIATDPTDGKSIKTSGRNVLSQNSISLDSMVFIHILDTDPNLAGYIRRASWIVAKKEPRPFPGNPAHITWIDSPTDPFYIAPVGGTTGRIFTLQLAIHICFHYRNPQAPAITLKTIQAYRDLIGRMTYGAVFRTMKESYTLLLESVPSLLR